MCGTIPLLRHVPLCVHVGSSIIYVYKICFGSNDIHLYAELFHLYSEHNFFFFTFKNIYFLIYNVT
jgi:hypothetical protein